MDLEFLKSEMIEEFNSSMVMDSIPLLVCIPSGTHW